MASLRAASDARAERLRRAREKERRRRERERREKEGGAFGRKRARPPEAKGKELERNFDDLLPEDSQPADDGPQLSAEVRALMAKLAAEEPREEEADEDVPKVSCFWA